MELDIWQESLFRFLSAANGSTIVIDLILLWVFGRYVLSDGIKHHQFDWGAGALWVYIAGRDIKAFVMYLRGLSITNDVDINPDLLAVLQIIAMAIALAGGIAMIRRFAPEKCARRMLFLAAMAIPVFVLQIIFL